LKINSVFYLEVEFSYIAIVLSVIGHSV